MLPDEIAGYVLPRFREGGPEPSFGAVSLGRAGSLAPLARTPSRAVAAPWGDAAGCSRRRLSWSSLRRLADARGSLRASRDPRSKVRLRSMEDPACSRLGTTSS